ncbi:MAG: radical SAM protein [Nitrospirae bacterium]|nr:radical SAM protein [Nitrospirota bacterium]
MSTNRFPLMYTAHAGLPILAEILERDGHQVDVRDEMITPFSPSWFDGAGVSSPFHSPSSKRSGEGGVALVGVSIETLWAVRGYEIAAEARKRGIPVIFGGPHATLNPDDALKHGDYVVRNEGEETLPDLLDALERGRPLESVKGLSFKSNAGAHIHNPARPFLTSEQLDTIPWPRLGKIHGWNSRTNWVSRFIHFTMVSRGCPFHCNFCSITPEFGKAYRSRSVESVIDELTERFDPEQQFLFFMDDSISGDKEYLKGLLDRMLTKNLVPRLGWHSQMRSDTAKDKTLMKLLQRTNCFFATFGFESIDDRTLRYMRKGQNSKLIRECIKTMQDHGIIVNGFFMFGSDHDTLESIDKTLEFAKENCVLAGFMPMTPFPGTPFYDDLERQGRIFTKHWEFYDVQHVVYQPKNMTPYELYMGCLNAYRRFYSDRRSMVTVKIRRAAPRLWKSLGLSNPLNLLQPRTYAFNFITLWPLFKLVDYGKEIAANLDYIHYIRNLDPDRPKEFVPHTAPLQNVLNWKHAKSLASNIFGSRALPS